MTELRERYLTVIQDPALKKDFDDKQNKYFKKLINYDLKKELIEKNFNDLFPEYNHMFRNYSSVMGVPAKNYKVKSVQDRVLNEIESRLKDVNNGFKHIKQNFNSVHYINDTWSFGYYAKQLVKYIDGLEKSYHLYITLLHAKTKNLNSLNNELSALKIPVCDFGVMNGDVVATKNGRYFLNHYNDFVKIKTDGSHTKKTYDPLFVLDEMTNIKYNNKDWEHIKNILDS